jgi:hypothetical protein
MANTKAFGLQIGEEEDTSLEEHSVQVKIFTHINQLF